MDIHAPEKPIHSVKEFVLHIVVVTCGILIALGLEGIREAIHERNLVREARENIRLEMNSNLENSQDEIKRVALYNGELKMLVADMPALENERPDQVTARLEAVQNPEYFFAANSWQAALSTQAVAHMSAQEVSAYAGAAESIKVYTALQQETILQETQCKAYFLAHPRLSDEERKQGMEYLIRFSKAERSLSFVGPQMQTNIKTALHAAEK